MKRSPRGKPTFRVLVASDGSPSSRAALYAAIAFPWPEPSAARAVVSLHAGGLIRQSPALVGLREEGLHAAARAAGRSLAHRWKDARAVTRDEPPPRAILGEAKRFGADAIVLGWRGHGIFARLIAGSVSRAVVSESTRPVLVVRANPRPDAMPRRAVVGFDGSPNAWHAVEFLQSLPPQNGAVAVLVMVLPPLAVPTAGRLPATVRSTVRQELAKLNLERIRAAKEILEDAVGRLRKRGWRARPDLRIGAPLAGLLAAAREHRASFVVVGARATRGFKRALLGSVAAGMLDQSPVPVVVVP